MPTQSPPDRVEYFAHSENDNGIRHRLAEHLRSVEKLAHAFAASFPWAGEVALAGALHDLGKYGDRFQKRLKGEEAGLDHWSTGALVALQRYGAVAAALAIEGHHIGLQCAASDQFAQRMKLVLDGYSPQGHQIRLSDADTARLQERARQDGLTIDKPTNVAIPFGQQHAWSQAIARMLDVRMLFSCLVDADYLDTEAHFKGGHEGKRYREAGPALDATRAANVLERHMTQAIRGRGRSSHEVKAIRAELWAAVSQAATLPCGTFSLTAPTGSGKTLAMLQFALTHAKQHGLKRIVLAVPYLSIIEQTASEYRKVFAGEPEHFVLEHHSLAGLGVESTEANKHDKAERQRRCERGNPNGDPDAGIVHVSIRKTCSDWCPT